MTCHQIVVCTDLLAAAGGGIKEKCLILKNMNLYVLKSTDVGNSV